MNFDNYTNHGKDNYIFLIMLLNMYKHYLSDL